jgi:hypothetical protein
VVEGGEGDKKSGQQQSQKEGPAAYARHDEGERALFRTASQRRRRRENFNGRGEAFREAARSIRARSLAHAADQTRA